MATKYDPKNLLRFIAIVGNSVFILWVMFNAIDSGFSGTPPEIASFFGLTLLLVLNTYLIIKQ